MDLFDHHREQLVLGEAPLAARMRPRRLDEFIGQDHIVGPGRLLRRAIAADQLSSVIFYGPPGTGKTTLAQIIANSTQAHFIAINAVLAGVKEIREAIAEAQDRRGQQGQRTILFIDEVHRFNKAQQDALLPWVENGTIVLIGATTENPYFEVNKALVSRSRLFQLRSLEAADLEQAIDRALADPFLGYGQLDVVVEAEARSHLVNVANGDARALLNALELAVETTEPDPSGRRLITLAVAEESIQQRAVLYDKEGDAHFDTISAFIKSVRGSDPDAALYWLARMVYSGEDPRFIFRRLIILASEDIGLADPQAVGVAIACATAFDRIGMPEGQYPLAQATLYLANTAKSNSALGYFEALKAVEQERAEDIPNALKDNNRDAKGFGHGANYKYPHAYRDHWVAQQYLPSGLQGQAFYQPSNQGWEKGLATRVEQRREAQIAALAEGEMELAQGLSFGPVVVDAATQQADRWIQRAVSQAGERLGQVRDRLFDRAQCQRHYRILDAKAGSGLLTWEAVRRVPEGQVYALVRVAAERAQLEAQALGLPALMRPEFVDWPLNRPRGQERVSGGQCPEWPEGLRFERVIGRNVLAGEEQWADVLQVLMEQLMPGGRLVLLESLPGRSQRLYSLIEPAWLEQPGLPKPGLSRPRLWDSLKAAEDKIYQTDPSLNWQLEDLRSPLEAAGLNVTLEVEPTVSQVQISQGVIDYWFGPGDLTYATRLAIALSAQEISQVRRVFEARLRGQTLTLSGAMVWLVAQSSPNQSPAKLR
jgi:putative ATPase